MIYVQAQLVPADGRVERVGRGAARNRHAGAGGSRSRRSEHVELSYRRTQLYLQEIVIVLFRKRALIYHV